MEERPVVVAANAGGPVVNNNNPNPPTHSGVPIPPFTGEDPTYTIQTFLLRIERQANYYSQTDEELVRYVPTMLIDTASDVYHEYANEIKTNWPNLRTRLLQDFRQPEGDLDTMNDFHMRVQQANENVQSYFTDKYRLCRLAFEGKPLAERSSAMNTFFILGLLPSIRIHVQRARPQTYQDAKKHALSEEKMQQPLLTSNQVAVVSRIEELETGMQNLQMKPDATIAAASADRPHSNRSCYNCGQYGHLRRDCRNRRRRRGFYNQRRGSPHRQSYRGSNARDYNARYERDDYQRRDDRYSRDRDRHSSQNRSYSRGRSESYNRARDRNPTPVRREYSPRGQPRFYNRRINVVTAYPRMTHHSMQFSWVTWLILAFCVWNAAAQEDTTTEVPSSSVQQWCEAETVHQVLMKIEALECDPSKWHNPNWSWSHYIVRTYDQTHPARERVCPTEFVEESASFVNNSKGTFLLSHEAPGIKMITPTTSYSECFEGKSVYRAPDGDVVVLHTPVAYQRTHKLGDDFGIEYKLICNNYNNRLSMLRQFALQDPTLAVRAFFNRTNLAARYVPAIYHDDQGSEPLLPDMLRIWICAEFLVESTVEDKNRHQGPGNRQPDELCFEYLPVSFVLPELPGQLYLHPVRKELVSYSPSQRCPWNATRDSLNLPEVGPRSKRSFDVRPEYTIPESWSGTSFFGFDNELTGDIYPETIVDFHYFRVNAERVQQLENMIITLAQQLNDYSVQKFLDVSQNPPIPIAASFVGQVGKYLLRGDVQFLLSLIVMVLFLERIARLVYSLIKCIMDTIVCCSCLHTFCKCCCCTCRHRRRQSKRRGQNQPQQEAQGMELMLFGQQEGRQFYANHTDCIQKSPMVVPQPYVHLLINGLLTIVMPDTGAQVTLCDISYFETYLKTLDSIIQPADITVYDFACQPMHLSGMTEVTIQLGKRNLKMRVYLMPRTDSSTCPFVLGNDFFEEYGLDLKVNRSKKPTTVHIGTTELPVIEPPKNEAPSAKPSGMKDLVIPLMYSVFLISAITLPPRSETVLTVGTSYGGTETCLFEPSTQLMERKGILLPDLLQNAHENTTVVKIRNPLNDYIHLHENTTLGTAFPGQVTTTSPVVNAAFTADEKRATNIHRTPENIRALKESLNKLANRPNLHEKSKRRLRDLLYENMDIFSATEHDLGLTSLCEHKIELLEGAHPVSKPAYRVPQALREKARIKLQQMEAAGLIENSSSPWAAPLVIIGKPDGSVRITTDFRPLNAMVKRDCFPIPRIDEMTTNVAGAVYLSLFDLTSGYFQVPLAPEDREKTAFISPFGRLYQYRVLPQGLSNSPATFQRLVQSIHDDTDYEFLSVYIDDTCIASRTFEDHLRHLQKFFSNIRKAGLKLKPSKADLAQREVRFLGYVVSGKGVKADPKKVQVVKDMERPQTQKELRRFLGVANYYRRLIGHFAEVAEPLHKLLTKQARFYWTPECETAWLTLKRRLASDVMIRHPDFRRPFVIHSDASDVALGAMLGQEDEGLVRPVSFYSRTLTKAERNYTVSEREALAVVCAVREWRHYLLEHPFTVITDHSALTWLMTMKDPIGRLARWSLKLQEYAGWMKIVHRPGSENVVADFLSRLKTHNRADKKKRVHFADEIGKALTHTVPNARALIAVNNRLHSNRLRQEQVSDPETRKIIQYLEDGTLPNNSTDSQHVTSMAAECRMQSGVLYHLSDKKKPYGPKSLYVPNQLRAGLLETSHDDLTSGHFALEKTYGRLRERYYWPGQYTDVQKHVRACRSCLQRKGPSKQTKIPLHPIQTEGTPWYKVSCDVLGPLRQTIRGNRFVVVFTDMFTKMTVALPTPDHTAETVAQLFVERIVCVFGAPAILLSDRGPEFRSELMRNICSRMGTRKIFTRSYRPSTNGLVERYNQTLANSIAKYGRSDDWDNLIPFSVFAYNTAVQSSSGNTPFFLNHGRVARLPIDTLLLPKPSVYQENISYVEQLTAALRSAWAEAENEIGKAQQRQMQTHRPTSKATDFHVGDLVALKQHVSQDARKFTRKWLTDFVIEKVGDTSSTLRGPEGEHMEKHLNDIFKIPPPYVRPLSDPPEWLQHNQNEDQRLDQRKDEHAEMTVDQRLHEPAEPTVQQKPPGPYNLRPRP